MGGSELGLGPGRPGGAEPGPPGRDETVRVVGLKLLSLTDSEIHAAHAFHVQIKHENAFLLYENSTTSATLHHHLFLTLI